MLLIMFIDRAPTIPFIAMVVTVTTLSADRGCFLLEVKMGATARHIAARNCFWHLKHFLHITVCQHGVYLENIIEGSN